MDRHAGTGTPGRPVARLARRHLALLLAVVVLWGYNFVPIRVALNEVPPFALAAARFTLAAIPWVFFVRPPTIGWRWVAAYGLAIGVGQFGLLFLGITLGMPAGLASLIIQLQVFLTVLLSFLVMRERATLRHVAGGAVAAAGLIVLGAHEFRRGSTGTLGGLAAVLAAAFFWAVGNLVVKRGGHGRAPDMLSLVVWSSLASPIPLALLSWHFEGGTAGLLSVASMSLVGWAALLFIAYGATLFGFAAWNRMLHAYPAALVAPFALIVPVAGLGSAALFLSERLDAVQILGCLLVMAGLAVPWAVRRPSPAAGRRRGQSAGQRP